MTDGYKKVSETEHVESNEGKMDVDKFREWFSVLLPVIFVLGSGILLIVEWRSSQTQQIEQLKEADKIMKASLMRQIKQLKESLTHQIEEKNHHILLNRKYMEKNRESVNDCAKKISKFEGIFFESKNVFGGLGPPHSIKNSAPQIIRR